MGARINYTKGQTVGDHGLVFLEEIEPYITPKGQKVRKAKFKCYCGEEFEQQIQHVKTGHAKSCGCYRSELGAERLRSLPKGGEHCPSWKGGVQSHYLYGTWQGMKRRCLIKDSHNYRHYGGRGITIHEPWIDDSKAFLDWIDDNLGERPDGFTLDRIDNDGNYEPGNLRWADQSTQVKNRRPTRSRHFGFNE